MIATSLALPTRANGVADVTESNQKTFTQATTNDTAFVNLLADTPVLTAHPQSTGCGCS